MLKKQSKKINLEALSKFYYFWYEIYCNHQVLVKQNYYKN